MAYLGMQGLTQNGGLFIGNVDISGFTGVVLLRALRQNEFYQTIGRCLRLENQDRIYLL